MKTEIISVILVAQNNTKFIGLLEKHKT